MVDVRMSMEEYLALLGGVSMDSMPSPILEDAPMPKKRKTSAYSRRYKANFRKVAPDFKLKSGKWAKNGFKRAVKEAHRLSQKK